MVVHFRYYPAHRLVAVLTMAESDLLTGVLDIRRVPGWRTFHVRPGRTAHGWRTTVSGNGVGFPDLLAVRGDRIVVAELKIGWRALTDEQRAWLAAFATVSVEAHVWRDTDYPDTIAGAL